MAEHRHHRGGSALWQARAVALATGCPLLTALAPKMALVPQVCFASQEKVQKHVLLNGSSHRNREALLLLPQCWPGVLVILHQESPVAGGFGHLAPSGLHLQQLHRSSGTATVASRQWLRDSGFAMTVTLQQPQYNNDIETLQHHCL